MRNEWWLFLDASKLNVKWVLLNRDSRMNCSHTLSAGPKSFQTFFIGEIPQVSARKVWYVMFIVFMFFIKKSTIRSIPRVPIIYPSNIPKIVMCLLVLELRRKIPQCTCKAHQTEKPLKKQPLLENLKSRFQKYPHEM